MTCITAVDQGRLVDLGWLPWLGVSEIKFFGEMNSRLKGDDIPNLNFTHFSTVKKII